MSPAVAERLKSLDEIQLLVGSHSAPPPKCDNPKGCFEEIYTWLFDLPWSDHPDETVSPVISAFMRRLNDGLPDDLRQQLKPYLVKQHGTANDGFDEKRGWLLADWSVHTVLPVWLELAGVHESVKALRELPPITDSESHVKARSLLAEIRDDAWSRRSQAIDQLRDRIFEALKRKPAAVDADAVDAAVAADADAVAVAVAADAVAADAVVAVAVAAVAAVAVAVAADAVAADAVVAVAAADADADAVAVAVAADAADADAADADDWQAIRKAVMERIRPQLEQRFRPTTEALFPSALQLLDKLIDPAKA